MSLNHSLFYFGIHEEEWDFPPHQLFAFAVGSFFVTFVVCNSFSNAPFISVTSSRARHSPVDGNERLDTCEFIISLVDVDTVNCLEGEWDFPPHQLFALAVGSFLAIFVACNPFSKAFFISVTSSLIRHSPFDGNE